MNSQLSAARRSRAGAGLDLVLFIVLLVASLGVRWLYARAVVFPPGDAPAFYLTTAENVVTGRGLEIDALWSYQVPFPAVTHPSHERLMPLTTAAIAAAFSIRRALTGAWEASLATGQMPGLIFGALLAPVTYILGRRALPAGPGNRWVSLGAALLIAINATLAYQSATADSSAPFALLAAGALAVAVRQPGERGGYLGAGLLVALAYLTRTDGLLLLVAIPLAWWLLPMPAPLPPVEIPNTPAARLAWEQWPRQRTWEQDRPRAAGPGLRHLVDLCVAFALIAAPWLVRNYLTFGTPLPSSMLNQAWLVNYTDNFNYLSHPTPSTWLAQSWSAILDQRLQALVHSGQVLLLGTFPWGVLALPGIWLLRRELPLFPSLVYGLLLVFGVALILPVTVLSGSFYHSFGVVMPYLALAAAYSVYRGGQLFRRPRLAATVWVTVAIAALLLAGWQVAQTLSPVADRHLAEKEQFEATAAWLVQNAAPDAIIMTDGTYSLNYASGHPCIALPGNEPPDSAWQAAERYGARYLIITQQAGLYPDILEAQPDPRFRLLAEIQGSQIYEIGEGQP